MNTTIELNLTAEELDIIHAALMHRERTLPDLIKAWGGASHRGRDLSEQLDRIPGLSEKVCTALVEAKMKMYA